MFYPACPVCGSKNVESNEPDAFDRGNRGMAHWARGEASMGHPHPLVKALSIAIMVGRQVYKRVPGGGEKRCECGHTFR